jgi:hypothetical protein
MLANVLSVRGVTTGVAQSGDEVRRMIGARTYGAAVFDNDRSNAVAMNPRSYGYCGPLIVLAQRADMTPGLYPGDELIAMPTGIEALIKRILRVLPAE